MTTSARNGKSADDQVYELNLNAVKVEANGLPPFRFLWGPSNKRFEMAHRNTLDQIPIMEAAARSEVEGVLETFRQALGERQWREFRKIPLDIAHRDELMEAYSKHCGVELGESLASTSS